MNSQLNKKSSSKTNILIAGDVPTICAGLRSWIEAEKDFNVIAESRDWQGTLLAIKKYKLDV